jgi:hypothetical protein
VNEKEPNVETSAFAKLWAEAFARLAQTAFTFSPDAVSPETLRQVRSGIFQALAQSWDEFLRSPQFMEGMKQMMDNAIAFRKLSSNLLQKTRQELGSVGADDIDALVVLVTQVESRLTQRLDEVAAQLLNLNRRLDQLATSAPARPSRPKAAQRKPRRESSHSPTDT